jgi:hypothetical protein
VDVFSTGIMAAELVVRYMDIAGFERVAATHYLYPDQRAALVDDACARLDTVSSSLSAVVRRCSAVKAKHRMSSDVAFRALQDVGVGRDGGAPALAAGSASASASAAASAAPAPVGTTDAAALGDMGSALVVDMSEALTAMEALQVPSDVSDRVCEAMVAAAALAGTVTGARFLQIVVDEGVKPAIAMKLRQRLGIAAVVPPPTVCLHNPDVLCSALLLVIPNNHPVPSCAFCPSLSPLRPSLSLQMCVNVGCRGSTDVAPVSSRSGEWPRCPHCHCNRRRYCDQDRGRRRGCFHAWVVVR